MKNKRLIYINKEIGIVLLIIFFIYDLFIYVYTIGRATFVLHQIVKGLHT